MYLFPQLWISDLFRIRSRTLGKTTQFACMFLLVAVARFAIANPTELYVSPSGNDSWSGASRSANDSNTDGPLATLTKARDVLRQRKSTDGLPDCAVVWVAPGRYELDKPFSLEAADSGSSSARITYQASPGGPVILSGSRRLKDFRPVTEKEILDRVPSGTRNYLREADLPAAGITNLGSVAAPGKRLEVFADGKSLPLVRWPKNGFVHIAKTLGDQPFESQHVHGDRVGHFTLDESHTAAWAQEPDLWLHGYWFWDWSDAYQQVERIDPVTGEIDLREPYHKYGYRAGQRCYVLNALCELDSPGEWYVDRNRQKLYLWPPANQNPEITLPLANNVIDLHNCAYVTLHGLTIEECRGTGIIVSGGNDVKIEKCTLRNTGGNGINISGQGHQVVGCDLSDTGEAGISASGGDRTTLSSSDILIENNHIQRFGRLFHTYRPAVSISGVGLRVRHNLIHDGPHNAIMINGNDHQIELNEIYDVCYESDDVGAIYMGRDWTQRGNVIRYNFFHDILGNGPYGSMAVYIDDMACGTAIVGNVFCRVGRAILIGGGRDNLIEGNIFIDCPSAVHISALGLGQPHLDLTATTQTLHEGLAAVPYKSSVWKEHYPKLANILDDEPLAPKGNVVRGNISVGGKWLEIREKARPYVVVENNLVDVDPLFVDRPHDNFQLKEDSPAWQIGFDHLPLNQIGLFQDERRATWPVEKNRRIEKKE